jgi:hypothetical protein
MKRGIRPVARKAGIHTKHRLTHFPALLRHVAEGQRRGCQDRSGAPTTREQLVVTFLDYPFAAIAIAWGNSHGRARSLDVNHGGNRNVEAPAGAHVLDEFQR